MIDIAKARALCEAATPEWFLYSEPEVGLPVDVFCRTADGNIRPMQDSQQDLEFAVSARTLLPEALDEIERLRAENARLQATATDADCAEKWAHEWGDKSW